MNAQDWLSRSVSKLLPPKGRKGKSPPAPVPQAGAAINSVAEASANSGAPGVERQAEGATSSAVTSVGRSTRERLSATLRQKNEALSPRVLRRTLADLRAVVDPSISEVEGGRRAAAVAQWYAVASERERRDCWLLMSEQFPIDRTVVTRAHDAFMAAVGTPDEPNAEARYLGTLVSPRRRLLQRFSAFPDGLRFLIDLRAEMLPSLKGDKRLQPLDVELESMFSTWLEVGFLELRRISWDSPASLIEKLIKYEAVHDIKSWADVKNRLDPDRRCYGFFHPRLPNDPLIFVEVALLRDVARGITPLLDEAAAMEDLKAATTAIFYSISNTQTGLRGVSFGDSLIKRVVETLKVEFPQLKTFATLSPIPGFRTWLGKNLARLVEPLDTKLRSALAHECGLDGDSPLVTQVLALSDAALDLPEDSAVRRLLLHAAARYLGHEWLDGKPLDPVARFHLGNGARVERINWAGDPSPKGMRQSCGLMVNYLYDLRRLDQHRAMLAKGKIPVGRAVTELSL